MPGPIFTPLAQTLPATVPFVGPETQERARGRAFSARLGANENAFGPSPLTVAAMKAAAEQVWMYGDPENHDLKTALARHHGCRPDNIVVGEGIDGLLGYLVRLTVGVGDPVVTSDGGYPTFAFHVAGFGGTLHKVPYRDDQEDPEALLAEAARRRAKLVYFANPDNPMGSWHPACRVAGMVSAVPEDSLLILDEAYVELAPEGTAPELDPDDPRVIRMRTFSKAYGMAGARIGYAICAAPLAQAFDKIRNHFGVSRMSQAGALAALEDRDWLARTRMRVAAARDRISDLARANGLQPLPSATNFVAIDCGGDARMARALLEGLIARDIFVRMPFVAPQNRAIRISCGTPAMLDALEAALPPALADARRSVDFIKA